MWLKGRKMTNDLPPWGHRKESLWCLESCSPQRLAQRELRLLLTADKQADVSSSVLQGFFFFKQPGCIIFERPFTRFFLAVLTLIRLMLIPFQLTIKQLFSRLIGRLHKPQGACCQMHFFSLGKLPHSRSVLFVRLFCLPGSCDADEIVQITTSGQLRCLVMY